MRARLFLPLILKSLGMRLGLGTRARAWCEGYLLCIDVVFSLSLSFIRYHSILSETSRLPQQSKTQPDGRHSNHTSRAKKTGEYDEKDTWK